MGSFQLDRKAVASVSMKRKDSADLYFLLTPQAFHMRSGLIERSFLDCVFLGHIEHKVCWKAYNTITLLFFR